MLSRRPSNGLFTYNFDLDRLRVTTIDPTTSLPLHECEHTAKLILTLRQFRDVPRGRSKKVEVGYLFILHSGTSAIERLDLRKLRQAVSSHGATPTYKIRGEGCAIEFQYLCSDDNIRKADIEFRKLPEYERALQILLSQGLSVVIKRPEYNALSHQPFISTVPVSLPTRLPTHSGTVRPSGVSGVPGAWNASFAQVSYHPSPTDRTSSISLPPMVAREVRSPAIMGPALARYQYTGHSRPDMSGICTPTQSQSQYSEEALPGHVWPSSRQPSVFLGGDLARQPFQASVMPELSSTHPQCSPFGPTAYGGASTPQSSWPSQSNNDQSLAQHVNFPSSSLYRPNNSESEIGALSSATNTYADSLLPPTRSLPFKSKNKNSGPRHPGSERHVQERKPAFNGNTMLTETRRASTICKTVAPPEDRAKVGDWPPETSIERRVGATVVPGAYDVARDPVVSVEKHRGLATGSTSSGLEAPPLRSADAEWQNNASSLPPLRDGIIRDPPKVPDCELLDIFSDLQGAMQQWQMRFLDGRETDPHKMLLNLQSSAQRLQAYLQSSRSQKRNDHGNRGHLRLRDTMGKGQLADRESKAAMVETRGEPKRRHTKEYKLWRDYYLFACRLYETKEERTDPEFIHRFLRGIPGTRALRWVQMGLLNCYPSMVRLSERRSGTTIIFTKDLKWSHVCDMVTRKLKLPFPKWEMG